MKENLQNKQQEQAKLEDQIKRVAQDIAPAAKELALWDSELASRRNEIAQINATLKDVIAQGTALDARIATYNGECAGRMEVKVYQARNCASRQSQLEAEKAAWAKAQQPVMAEFNAKVALVEKIVARRMVLAAKLDELKVQSDELKSRLQSLQPQIADLRQTVMQQCGQMAYDEQAKHCSSINWDVTAPEAPAGHLLKPGGREYFGIKGAGESWPGPTPEVSPGRTIEPIPPVGPSHDVTPPGAVGLPVTDFKPKPTLGPSSPPPSPTQQR